MMRIVESGMAASRLKITRVAFYRKLSGYEKRTPTRDSKGSGLVSRLSFAFGVMRGRRYQFRAPEGRQCDRPVQALAASGWRWEGCIGLTLFHVTGLCGTG